MWKDKAQKVKDHVVKYRVPYIFGTSCAFGYMLMSRGGKPKLLETPQSPAQITNIVAPVFNNENTVNFGGYQTKIVKCLETGEIWEKVTEAAQDNEVPVSLMSRHLNGHKPDMHGLHFEIIGMGTSR